MRKIGHAGGNARHMGTQLGEPVPHGAIVDVRTRWNCRPSATLRHPLAVLVIPA